MSCTQRRARVLHFSSGIATISNFYSARFKNTRSAVYTRVMPCDVHEGVTADWSALFLLDVVARYAVDRCGAEDNLLTAFASVACVLPIWVWVCSLILMLVEIELYLNLARYTLTMLTILQIMLLAVFHQGPAISGCGPSRSFPNPQTAISSYSLAIYTCYIKMDPSCFARHRWMLAFMTIQNCAVIQSVLWIGFASPVAAIAGCAVGTMSACLLHEILTLSVSCKGGWLGAFVRFAERSFGVVLTDTLLCPEREDTPINLLTEDIPINLRLGSLTMGYHA
jgi:hypothetical protein